MTKRKRKPLFIVIFAIIFAILIGTWTGKTSGVFGITFYSIYDLIGKLFINALTLIVVPLVSASIITGVAKIGSESSFGRLGLKMFGFYLTTSFLAILIGILFVNLIDPGIGVKAQGLNLESAQVSDLKGFDRSELHPVSDFLQEIIPANILDAFAKGNMLGLILDRKSVV